MDTTTAQALIALNNRFYQENSASFSATRSAPWEGWKQLENILHEHGWRSMATSQTRLVFDMASGNLRFEHFLTNAFPSIDFTFHAVDSCVSLAEHGQDERIACRFRQCDILEALISSDTEILDGPLCDLSVSFGFMHHVPSTDLRHRVLEALVERTRIGGLIVLSFWQFMNDERLAAKAQRADRALGMDIDISQLEPNDHFLGWQSDPSPLRYCHHFDECEIDELVASVGTKVRELTRYSSDGASGTLNRYLVLERLC